MKKKMMTVMMISTAFGKTKKKDRTVATINRSWTVKMALINNDNKKRKQFPTVLHKE